MDENTIKNGTVYVKWSALVVLMGVLIGVLGVMWTEVKQGSEIGSELKADMREVKTDVEWIKMMINSGQVSIIRIWDKN